MRYLVVISSGVWNVSMPHYVVSACIPCHIINYHTHTVTVYGNEKTLQFYQQMQKVQWAVTTQFLLNVLII